MDHPSSSSSSRAISARANASLARAGLLNTERVTYLGYANARAKLRRFGIYDRDRLSHIWIVGKTGVGKSTLLSKIARQDLAGPRGFLLLDPHGDLAQEVQAAADQIGRKVRFLDHRIDGWSLNPFDGVPESQFALAVAGLTETFKKIWSDEWGPRLSWILTNLFWTLLYMPDGTLLDVPRLLSDTRFRNQALKHVDNPAVTDFWRHEYANWSQGFRSIALAPVQNKIGAILADPRLRKATSAEGESIRFRESMDDGSVVIADLSKGIWGEGPSDLAGSLLLSRLVLAALSRAETTRDDRKPFWVLIDEFQSFATEHTTTMLGELRKYGVGVTAANQQTGQLDREVGDALAGNVGTTIVFRVGGSDAGYFSTELGHPIEAFDLLTLPNFECYLRLLAGASPTHVFSSTIHRASPISRLDSTAPVLLQQRG